MCILLHYVTLDREGGREPERYTNIQLSLRYIWIILGSYPHADDGHSEVGASQVNSQSALCLQDVIDVLGDRVLHWRKTERLLEGFIQVNAT